MIYNEGIEYALHRKRSTREYTINTDTPKGEIFKIRMHVSKRVGLKKPMRGRNATAKVIGRLKISKMKRNQLGTQLATG